MAAPQLADLPTVPQLVERAAARYGDTPFLVANGTSLGFREVADSVSRIARHLTSRGVVTGDRVILVAPNLPELVQVWLATVHLGALPAPLNPTLTDAEIASLVADVSPALVVTDAAGDDRARAAVGGEVAVETLDTIVAEGRSQRPAAVVPAQPDDPAALVFTSGTTSRPKAALVTHAAYVLSGEAFPSWVGLRSSDRLWACLPLFHMNAQAYSLMTALAHGLSLTLSERFSASRFWTEAAELGVTATNLVGAMLEILARQPAETYRTGGLRLLYAAPAPAGPQRRDLERRFGVDIVSGYGMTEVPFGTIDSLTSRGKPGCIGRPRTHPWRAVPNEVRVAADHHGDAGELLFRNPTVSPGYWNAAKSDRRVDLNGWLHTGDVGRVDDDGDITLTGRVKEMIRRRGENIAPLEIEEALMSHPKVLIAAAFGMPSDLSEEDVGAAVVPRDGERVKAEELRVWCRSRLSAYKVPEVILIRDALPMTPTMRVAKYVLAADAHAERMK